VHLVDGKPIATLDLAAELGEDPALLPLIPPQLLLAARCGEDADNSVSEDVDIASVDSVDEKDTLLRLFRAQWGGRDCLSWAVKNIVRFWATPIKSQIPMRILIRFQVPSRADTVAVAMRWGDAHRFDGALMGPQLETSGRSNLIRAYHETRITGTGAGRRSRIGWPAVFLAAWPGGLASLRGGWAGAALRGRAASLRYGGWAGAALCGGPCMGRGNIRALTQWRY